MANGKWQIRPALSNVIWMRAGGIDGSSLPEANRMAFTAEIVCSPSLSSASVLSTPELKPTPMAKYERFEELPVWKVAAQLYNAVLDILDTSDASLLSPGFRNQLDRAALSVSNNIAEGFERSTKAELFSFIAIARGSAGEVRSMIAVVKGRRKLKPIAPAMENVRQLAESCARQLTGWETSLKKLNFEGSRHLPEKEHKTREAKRKFTDFRLQFLRTLKPEHPLYNSPEAQAARGASEE